MEYVCMANCAKIIGVPLIQEDSCKLIILITDNKLT